LPRTRYKAFGGKTGLLRLFDNGKNEKDSVKVLLTLRIRGGSKYVCIEITEVKTADDDLQQKLN
jgi:hypothetical protein